MAAAIEVSVVLPVAVKVPVIGLYNSATLEEPVIKTFPFRRRVAVWFGRAAIMRPVSVNVPVTVS
jgi:hypothetical protein